MNPIRRIIAATDFSVAAGRAVGRAALIAKEQRAELHLLHGVHPLSLYPGTEFGLGDLSRHDQAIEAGALTQLEELAVTLRERFGIATHAVTRIGRAHTAITTYAQQVEANLVVVGARGENTLLDLLLGSTAARVLRLASCPVLIVKLQAQQTPYREAIAALDFSPGSAAVLALCREVAPEARIELLHVYDTTLDERMRQAGLEAKFIEDYRQRALAEAEAGLDGLIGGMACADAVSRHIMTGYPAVAILERIAARHAELIVLGRHGKGGLQEFLLGSVAKDVACAAACDVLVAPPPGASEAAGE